MVSSDISHSSYFIIEVFLLHVITPYSTIIMNTKSFFITLFIVTYSLVSLQAQQSVVAGGGDATGIGGSASYSLGQVADTTNQGVQQPYEFATVSVEDNAAISLHCSVYPNPAAAYVTLQIDLTELQHLRYELLDINGRLLFSNSIVSNQTTIPIESLPAAIYMLNVTDNTNILETFKIIKKQ